MESNNSYGTSWADQWDYNSDPLPTAETKKYNSDPLPTAETKKSAGAGGGGFGKKVGEGFGKTKVVASTGMKKVKEGTTVRFQWIKDKYHKTTQKQSNFLGGQ